MNGSRLWLTAAALQTLLLVVSGGHHRRSTAQASLSKGGWRPVVNSGGLLYGSFGTAPLHAPTYKIPVPVLDMYQSSARPLAARDVNKLTSIAQSYRPTTHRTVPPAQPSPSLNQPINSYHNPFAFQNNGLTHYKFQNYPLDSVLLRNPHNPYRPVYSKYPTKFKQPSSLNHHTMLTNIQPIHFGQYPTVKPLDIFGKPIENYARPADAKPQATGPEIFKPEVFKLPDSATASQSVQQVKTAQQQSFGTLNQSYLPYSQYAFQDAVLPSNILGTFNSYGAQTARDPGYPTIKTTYLPPQPTKQTIFNSFSYSPNYKSTPIVYSTTPRLQTTPNQVHFGSTFGDFKITPTPHSKIANAPKIDPNAGAKDHFKASPQDPFTKHYQNDYNRVTVTTYNPVAQTSTLGNNFYDYFPPQQNVQTQKIYDQQNAYHNYDQKKQKIHDSFAAGVNQQVTKQYPVPTKPQSESIINLPYKPTYEVTETTEPSSLVHSSSAPWTLTSQPYDYNNQKSSEESVKQQEHPDTSHGRPAATPLPELIEEYAIVTEAEKGYDNSLGYDNKVESQSRRPLGDDFEPIGKNKLKDYYYKVSTPLYDDYSTQRRTKKPAEAIRVTTQPETTTHITVNNDDPNQFLPTLPPNQHFKRPSAPEPVDKDRIRKRNKNRRRRPALANINRNREETSTHANVPSTEPTPTETDEVHTIRPRIRPASLKPQPNLTTPSVSTDLTTSALPTISPTIPTIVKKKLAHRRPLTTDRTETTTNYHNYELNNESPIMKIATRPQFSKSTSSPYEYKNINQPDYTHKQDEKDTPTSDVAVSLTDTLKTTADIEPDFSFHKDLKPIETKFESATNQYKETTTEFLKDIDVSNEVTTFAPRDPALNTGKAQRPRIRNKYNRPKFNVKDYRSRLSSTTTTEKPVENTPKLRFPQRRPNNENLNSENDNATERKRFTPKDPRHKLVNGTEFNEQTEKEIHSIRQSVRQRPAAESSDGTQKVSGRVRNGSRRPRPTEQTTEALNPTTVYNKRPLRKKIKDSDIGESVHDIVTETTVSDDHKNDISSERSRSESAIMKIADKKHLDHMEHLFEHSKRVSDLTLAASKDYNKPGMFKTVSSNSRRIPNYFTIATDDPILPIEAFFPQLNQKKES